MNSFGSKYVYVSQSVKNVWERKGLENYKASVIYDGVRAELYQSRTIPSRNKIRMIFLGGYAKSKGQEDLIEALNNLPEELKKLFEIDFYGNGERDYIKYLEKEIENNGLSKVMKLHSYRHDIWKIVPEYDVGLNCSYIEGFGRVTVEYMMSGLCPIASNGGATPEIIQNGKTGIMYEALNKEALRSAIIWAINNQEAVHKLGENAEKSARQNFSMEKHARKIKKLYYEVVKDV